GQEETCFCRHFLCQTAPQRLHSFGLPNDGKDGVIRQIIPEDLGSGAIGKEDAAVHCHQKNRIRQVLKQKRRRPEALRQQSSDSVFRWPSGRRFIHDSLRRLCGDAFCCLYPDCCSQMKVRNGYCQKSAATHLVCPPRASTFCG